MTSVDLAREFTEIWEDLDSTQINTVLANNVNLELLQFFVDYAEQFAAEVLSDEDGWKELCQKLPNLLVIGYLIRLVEERVD